MKKVFFFGATGIIGKNFYSIFKKKYKIIPTYNKKKIKFYKKFDIKKNSFSNFIKSYGIPEAIIFAISISDHDKAAIKKNESSKVNYDLIIKMLKQIKNYPNTKLIFLSTQMVLKGNCSFSSENAKPLPIITYGKQKLKVEKFITKNFKNFLILRLAKVYGHKLKDNSLITNFLYKIKKNVKKFYVANDQFFNPLYIGDLIKIIDYGIKSENKGIFHVGGPKRYSRLEVIKKVYGYLKTKKKIKIKLIGKKLNSFNQIERHPLDTSFNIKKLKIYFPIKLNDIDYVYKKVIKNYF